MVTSQVVRGFVYSTLFFGLLVALGLSGCNSGLSGGGTPPPLGVKINSISTYYPNNSSLSLPYAIAGQAGFTLLVNGSGFTSSAEVEWNGNPLPTMFGDSTDLAATVTDSLIASPGRSTITVSESGAISNAIVLAIASPAAATAGVIALVTAGSDGSPANGDSLVNPSISATGRYVAFQSNATNLAPGPTSGYQEIYERDACIGTPSGCTPTTIRITITSDGSPVNGHSRDSAISADGRYVAFDSSATNILPSSGACSPPTGFSCVFLRDTCVGAPVGCTPATLPISVSAQGAIAPGGGPQMSPDARFVSFGSSSSSLGLGGSTVTDVFVHDTCIGANASCVPTTIRVSVPSDGSQGNQNSQQQTINSSGRFTAFVSYATNLVSNETGLPGIFFRDACIGVSGSCTANTSRVDIATDGTQANNFATSDTPALDSTGRLIAFGSAATNLAPTNVNTGCANANGCAGVYIHDTCAGVSSGCAPSTTLISIANDGTVGNCSSPGNAGGLSMSADGRFVAFGSIATNLSPDDSFAACGWEDIFVRDTCFGVSGGCVPSTVRVSVASSPNPGTSANSSNTHSAMSSDGHYVVFISSATNLLPGVVGNGHAMVYLAKTGF